MKHIIGRYMLMLGLAAAGLVWNGEIWPTSHGNMIATAEAVVGQTGDTGQLCRCGPALHRRGRSTGCGCAGVGLGAGLRPRTEADP